MKSKCSFDAFSHRFSDRFQKITRKQYIPSLAKRCMTCLMGMALVLLSGLDAMAETYYSQGSLPVNIASNWNTSAGGGGLTPADFTGTHTWIIQTGHNMTTTGDWAAGGVATVVINGGLTVSSAYLVTITGSMTVNGTLTNAGTYTAASAVTATDGITVNGTYDHNQNGGYVPTATWTGGSLCMVTGWTSAPSLDNSSFDQPFVNFTWNCPNQTVDVSFRGHAATVSGTFTLASSGSNLITPGGSPTSYGNFISTGGTYYVTADALEGEVRTVNVTNDFLMDGGHFYQGRHGLSTLEIGGNYTMRSGSQIVSRWPGASTTVHGDFLLTGGFFRVAYTASATLTVMGDFSITGPDYATFFMSDDSNSGTLYVAGNFTYTAGLITENPGETGSGNIIFNGSGTQIFTSTRPVTSTINFTVNNGAVLQMAAESTVINGAGTFTLSAGGTLGVTSANGITADPAVATGNIQTTSARVFSEGANYIYNGTTPQVTGTGLAQNTPADLTISNSSGVTLSDETTVSGSLTLSGGSLITGSNTLIIDNALPGAVSGGSASSYVLGTLRRNIASGINTYAFPVGTSSGYAPVSLIFGTATEGGYLNVFTTDGDHPELRTSDFDPDRTVNRTWSLQTSAGLGTVEYDAFFNWSASDRDAGFDHTTAVAGRYAGSAWTMPAAGSATETSIQVTGLTGFGEFQAGNDLNVSEPTTPAAAVSFSNVNAGDLILSWTNGDGASRVVLMKSGSAVDSYPADRVTYTADALFGNGTQAGDGNYSVYNGSGSSVRITGLTPGTTYHVAVFEYNGPEGHEDYLADNPATGYRQTAAAGIYRSAATGNWNAPGTWEFYDGSAWAAAVATPSSLDDEVAVLTGHTVSVTEDAVIDQLSVATGGQISVAPGITLNVDNGPDEYDITVNGALVNSGTITGNGAISVNGSLTNGGVLTVSGPVSVNDGGRYIHSTSGTTLPPVIWQTGSTCEITGWTNATALTPSFDQDFYNFTWNCPNQSVNVSFAGYVAAVSGTFTLISTGTGNIYPGGDPTYGNFSATGGTYNMTYNAIERTVRITNDFSMAGGTFFQSYAAVGTLTVGRNFLVSGSGYFNLDFSAAGSLYVTGDFSVQGGNFRMSRDSNTGILYLAGNFTFTAGDITETGTGSGEIIFNGYGPQLYNSSRAATGTINFTVADGATLQMASAGSTISSGGTFTLAAGGTLGITSGDGITADPALLTGNIRTTTARVFSDGANYIYNGTTPQVTGTGLTQHTPANLSVINSSGLTLSAATTISGCFSISGSSSVNLGTGLLHTTRSLNLGGVGQQGGTYGGTGSGAVNILPAFFAATSGILDNSCPAGTWLGGTSTDWSTASNWSGGVPGTATDAVITSTITNQPVISAGVTADCHNLTVDPGASLTVLSAGVASNGSLIVHGTSTGNVDYYRVMPADLYRYVSSPVVSATLPSGTVFWKWNEETGYWGDTPAEEPVTACETGKGYTMLATGSGVTFTGEVLTDPVIVTATAPYGSDYVQDRGTWGGGGWNLLGNPYPSALRAVDSDALAENDFIHQNFSSFDPAYQAIYIYDGAEYDYIAPGIPGYTSGMGVFPGNDIQAGQGFFVLAHHDEVQFTFMPAMRTHNTSAVMTKSGSVPWPGVSLKVKSESGESATVVAYGPRMSTGLDAGYDVGYLSSGAGTEVYTVLPGDGSDYNFARQALPISEAGNTAVPVGLDFPGGGEVTFSAVTVPAEGYRFWLEDKVAGIYTDLAAQAYTVTLPGNTYGTGRFFIIASANTPSGTDQPDADNAGLRIWHYGGRVLIQGEVSEGSLCEIYNTGGGKILERKLTGGEMNIVELPPYSSGIVVVKVSDGPKTVTKKVALIG